jgi:hypothetical protein
MFINNNNNYYYNCHDFYTLSYFFFTIILRDRKLAMLWVGAPVVECRLVKMVALRIWAPAVKCRSAKPWVWWRYHPKAEKITLQRRRMLLAALEKETKAWVLPTHAKPLHLHQIQFFFFFSFGSTVAARKIRRRKEGSSRCREERKKLKN